MEKGNLEDESVGERIERLRGESHLTKDKLSKATGISSGVIKQFESGSIKKPSKGAVKKIAGALDITEKELLEGEED